MKWEILNKKKASNTEVLIKALLKNRGITAKKEIDEFLGPKNPEKIVIEELGIKKSDLQKVIERFKKAKRKKERVIIFGDYDCDGVCATAILWEALYKLGYDVLPYIPDRFEEGYGIKVESIQKLLSKVKNLKLIITVDNGIVAYDAINEAKKQGIDVLVIDHHTKGEKKLNTNYLIHSTKVCGSALSWFMSKELGVIDGLDLVAIGTVADQMPLIGINRSLVKYGLLNLQNTKRKGLRMLIDSTSLKKIGVYEIGFMIAPRINAMGRLSHALDSLRLLCTRNLKKASNLVKVLNDTNVERQKIVEEVLSQTLKLVQEDEKIIVIEGDYHEGVIGLASGKITEKLYRPSIVLSRGEKISKASARSISGFNIIDAIRETGLILEGGGHPMAAGFSIENTKIEEFKLKINEISKTKLTKDALEKKLIIDLELDFKNINDELSNKLQQLEPTGYGNFPPVFVSSKVKIIESKPVGVDGKHLKLKLSQGEIILDAIWFGFINFNSQTQNQICNVVYSIEQNTWNNKTTLQLKIKDIQFI